MNNYHYWHYHENEETKSLNPLFQPKILRFRGFSPNAELVVRLLGFYILYRLKWLQVLHGCA
nr:MAG TPA: hypothetical protein [Herelleviridae sp.]DAS90514.1 MAG TPA: hypothetical protein [Herelleviridae sp.]